MGGVPPIQRCTVIGRNGRMPCIETGSVSQRTMCLVAFFLAALLGPVTRIACAQGIPEWSEPARLYLTDAEYELPFPVLSADAFGQVHVVAARNARAGTDAAADGTIFYTRWDGQQWSEPLDIVAAPRGQGVSAEQLLTSSDGQLHLLWWSDQLYWSQANAWQANSAHAWMTQALVPGVSSGDLAIRKERDIAIAYIRGQDSVGFMHSLDSGRTWAIESVIWSAPSDLQACRDVRLEVDRLGTYHVAWTETDAASGWNPSGIWYARSPDGGETWTDYYHVPDRGSYVNIGFDSDDNVHLLWDHNVGSADGRYQDWSQDGGHSWRGPTQIFPGLSGRTGYPRTILDSDGTLHQVASGAGRGLSGGIYYSRWSDDRWSEPILISAGVGNSEGPAVAMLGGTSLCAVWRSWDDHDVFYATYETGAPAVAPVPTPQASLSVMTSTSQPTLADTPELTPTVRAETGWDKPSEDDVSRTPSSVPLLLGLLAASVLVGAALGGSRLHGRSRL